MAPHLFHNAEQVIEKARTQGRIDHTIGKHIKKAFARWKLLKRRHALNCHQAECKGDRTECHCLHFSIAMSVDYRTVTDQLLTVIHRQPVVVLIFWIMAISYLVSNVAMMITF
jgi:hypothetical protein